MSELNEKKRDKLPKQEFAFPKERKEPLNDASHVRNAVARFDQVKGVSDEERDEAWKRIKSAASRTDAGPNAPRYRVTMCRSPCASEHATGLVQCSASP